MYSKIPGFRLSLGVGALLFLHRHNIQGSTGLSFFFFSLSFFTHSFFFLKEYWLALLTLFVDDHCLNFSF